MRNGISKEDKAEIKKAKEIAKYSVDYDMSMVIRYVFKLLFTLFIGLFTMETIHIITHLVVASQFPEKPMFMTSEIIHTAFGFVGGASTIIVQNFFAKMMAERQKEQKDEPKQKEGNQQ